MKRSNVFTTLCLVAALISCSSCSSKDETPSTDDFVSQFTGKKITGLMEYYGNFCVSFAGQNEACRIVRMAFNKIETLNGNCELQVYGNAKLLRLECSGGNCGDDYKTVFQIVSNDAFKAGSTRYNDDDEGFVEVKEAGECSEADL